MCLSVSRVCLSGKKSCGSPAPDCVPGNRRAALNIVIDSNLLDNISFVSALRCRRVYRFEI